MREGCSQVTAVAFAGGGTGPRSYRWAYAPERVGKRAPAVRPVFGVRDEVVG